jgi:hypothetical protein
MNKKIKKKKESEEKTHITPHLQWPLGLGKDLGGLMHTPILIVRYPKSMQRKFSL